MPDLNAKPAAQRLLEIGLTLMSPGKTIGESDINLFAGLVGDFTPVHVDESFARTTPHGTRIAHGPLGMSVAIGMFTHTGLLGERVIGLVNLNWSFSGPVKIGDTIRARGTVKALRPTSKPGRNLLTMGFDVINQDDQVVQSGEMIVVLKADN